MLERTIAVDIDDVLTKSTDLIRQEANYYAGIDLQPEHYMVPGEYWNYYETIWEAHGILDKVNFDNFELKLKSDVLPQEGAVEVLHRLSRRFNIVVITARNEQWREATETWLEQHFIDTPLKLYFAGNTEHAVHRTKGQLAAELGASWLIDDHVKHCIDANIAGVTALLFGSYGWQQSIPDTIIQFKNWQEIEEYFDGIS